MPLFVLGDYDVPVTMMPLGTGKFRCRTREGFPVEQTVMTACLAISLDDIHPANNDNERVLEDV